MLKNVHIDKQTAGTHQPPDPVHPSESWWSSLKRYKRTKDLLRYLLTFTAMSKIVFNLACGNR